MLMKIKKINGKYIKPGLRADTKVPLLAWLPIVLALSAVLLLLSMHTMLLIDQSAPLLTLSRKHAYRVAVTGDIACGPKDENFNEGNGIVDACRQKDVGRAVEIEHSDALFLLGDLQYPSGEFSDFERSFVPFWRDIRKPIYSVPGNHDYGQGGVAPGDISDYHKALDTFFPESVHSSASGQSYYSFNLGQWEVYALDSNCEYIGGCGENSPQYEWLKDKLESSRASCSIALWHHPVRTSGIHNTPEDTARMTPIRTLLVSNTIEMILTAHDHHYERFEGEVNEFVVGTGGHSLRKVMKTDDESSKLIDSSFGYLYLTLYPSRYNWQFKTPIGEVLDAGSGVCT